MAAVTIKNDFGAQENKVCQCFQFFTTKAFDCVDHSKLKNSERDGLKLNIQKTKIMASGPITSWQIEGENWKQ